MKYVYILGACGSIGTQTIDVINQNKNRFKVVGISVGHDLRKALDVIKACNPQIVCFRKAEDIKSFQNYDFEKVYGDEGLKYIAACHRYTEELVVNALVGSAGLMPTVEAIKAKKDIALANKETLVMAGYQIKKLINQYQVKLYPIDSEHSAIWQCLQGENHNDIKRLIITASGGSFRDKTREELENVTKEDALKHPNWSMGAKITIDSATMMNKGFEVIEAHHLFDIDPRNIHTVIHRESIVHSMVEFNDGLIKAQLGLPDMRGPISYALLYPEHVKFSNDEMKFDALSMHFEKMSFDRFPCLLYAYLAIAKGGLYPAVLNAANEAAVRLFLDNKIKFLDIEKIIKSELDYEYDNQDPTIDEILEIDQIVQKRGYRKYGDK